MLCACRQQAKQPMHSSGSAFLQCVFHTPNCIVPSSQCFLKLYAFAWLQCSSSWEVSGKKQDILPMVPPTHSLSLCQLGLLVNTSIGCKFTPGGVLAQCLGVTPGGGGTFSTVPTRQLWAPRTRKRHQQEHRPQRPTESSDPTQHARGRTGDRPGPRKGATTRRNVTRGVSYYAQAQ